MIPQKGWMIVERELQPKNIIIPENAEPASDEIYRVVKLNDFVVDHIKLKEGDLVALVGYIHKVSYKGKMYILAHQKDVILKIKEE